MPVLVGFLRFITPPSFATRRPQFFGKFLGNGAAKTAKPLILLEIPTWWEVLAKSLFFKAI